MLSPRVNLNGERPVQMENFIRIYDDALPGTVCRKIMDKFESDNRKFAGKVTANEGLVVIDEKKTTELLLNDKNWECTVKVLLDNLFKYFAIYREDVKFMAGSDHTDLITEIFRIKRYEIGNGFDWHIDCNSKRNNSRVLAIQWYFNTVDEGGHTEFEDQQISIQPVEGRLAFFPVSWMYRHRGCPPSSGPKYICTNFVRPTYD